MLHSEKHVNDRRRHLPKEIETQPELCTNDLPNGRGCESKTSLVIESYRESILDELVSSVTHVLIRQCFNGRNRRHFTLGERNRRKVAAKLKFWLGNLPVNYLVSLDPDSIIPHAAVLRSIMKTGRAKIIIRRKTRSPPCEGNKNTSSLSCCELGLTIACEKDCIYFIVQAMKALYAEIVEMHNVKTTDGIFVYTLKMIAPYLKEEIVEEQLENFLHTYIMNCVGVAGQHYRAVPSTLVPEPIDIRKMWQVDIGKSSHFGSPWPCSVSCRSTPDIPRTNSSDNKSYFSMGDESVSENRCVHSKRTSASSSTGFSTVVPRFSEDLVYSSHDAISVPDEPKRKNSSGLSNFISVPHLRTINSCSTETSSEYSKDILEQSSHVSFGEESVTGDFERQKRSANRNVDFNLEGNFEFSIAMEDLKLSDVLGMTFRSMTYCAELKGQTVAAKVFRFVNTATTLHHSCVLQTEEDMTEQTFRLEVEALQELVHPNICQLLGTCNLNNQACLVLEYVCGGDLHTYIHSEEGVKVPLSKLLALMVQVAEGITYIHSKDYIHRDIKPPNLLIDTKRWICKIADLGVCCRVGDDVVGETGTYRYMAPEVIRHEKYGKLVDVYSFGILLLEIVSKKIPFEGVNPMQVAYAVAYFGLRPELPQGTPQDLCQLVKECWRDFPESRPTFAELCHSLRTVMENLGQ